MYHFRFILNLLFITLLSASCQGGDIDFAKSNLIIASNGDKESIVVADYFYKHLNSRNKNKASFRLTRSDAINGTSKGNIVYFELVPDLDSDYEFINEGNKLSVFARNRHTFRWLSYMLIDHIAGFHTIEVADLPPHYIDFQSGKNNFTFNYRDPHLLPNLEQDLSGILHTHNVDNDWGLWGHNLKKVFTDFPINKSFALVDGKTNPDQFCFSADNTFSAISNFVLDEYGDGNTSSNWFMISPNDNDLVCTCASCSKLGNTATNATPAVTNLIAKLAKQYPNHHFFTTAYRTTQEPPAASFEHNIGVLYSTIDLNKSVKLDVNDRSVVEFVSQVNKWKQKNARIYLWDYISNFDDYLSPYPVLERAKNHLLFFKSLGIEGIFFNGSGYDYAAFDDVKTYVLSALLIDPDLVVADLASMYFKRFYPVAGDLLLHYYLDLEKETSESNKNTEIYSSFRNASKSYFNSAKFDSFYNKLLQIEDRLGPEEKEKIELLLDALSYTKLQVLYHQKEVLQTERSQNMDLKSKESIAALNRLNNSALNGSLQNYKEENGKIDTYINEWNTIEEKVLKSNRRIAVKNIGKRSEDDNMEIGLLNNQLLGFPSDFNQGWFLSANDLHLECVISNVDINEASNEIEIRFLLNERHRMLVPQQIEIIKEGVSLGQFSEKDFQFKRNLACFKKEIKIEKGQKLEIKIMKNKALKNAVIACDEIQLY